MKGAQREALRNMPADRKRMLLSQRGEAAKQIAAPQAPQATGVSSTEPAAPKSSVLSQWTGASSGWSSWWAGAAAFTGTGQPSPGRSKDSPAYYAEQLHRFS